MRFTALLRSGAGFAGVTIVALVAYGQGQPALPKAEGIPPRATPTDYEFHAQAGTLTIAAEFTGHTVGTPEGNPLTTEEFVVVEAAVYGPPGTHINLAPDNFSLRINGKKATLPGLPYGMVVKTLKDPEMEPPASAQKSNTSISTGGGGGNQGDTKPGPVKVPVEMRRAWEQRLRKASLPEGDRALPQAGLLYFSYHGKTDKLQSLELIYTGPAGQATMSLQP